MQWWWNSWRGPSARMERHAGHHIQANICHWIITSLLTTARVLRRRARMLAWLDMEERWHWIPLWFHGTYELHTPKHPSAEQRRQFYRIQSLARCGLVVVEVQTFDDVRNCNGIVSFFCRIGSRVSRGYMGMKCCGFGSSGQSAFDSMPWHFGLDFGAGCGIVHCSGRARCKW